MDATEEAMASIQRADEQRDRDDRELADEAHAE